MSSGSQNGFFALLILILIPVGLVFWWKNKKKKQNEPQPVHNKKTSSDNEAWQTVKKYLKDKNEYGKEIVNLFAVKRKTTEDLKNESKVYKQRYKEEKKAKKLADKELKEKDPEKYKAQKRKERKQKQPELWILVFVTKNPKTGKVDPERMIEAEIVYEKISKKQTNRKIVYHDNVDYDKEIEWIKPLKEKDEKERIKKEKQNKERLKKIKAKEAAKKNKKKQKE